MATKNAGQIKQATALRGEQQDGGEVEFIIHHTVGIKITPGQYEVQFEGAEKKHLWVSKFLLSFRVIQDGEFHGVELSMYCPIPKDGKKWGVGSKYMRAWALAMGRLPDRFDRMSTNVFQRKIFLAEVRTVDRDSKQRKIPEGAQYSIIDSLIQKIQ